LRTAYVEAVATEPAFQRRGFATAVMQRVAHAIGDFDLGGLSPSEVGFYERLGWELWRGPLSIRSAAGLIPTPNERVMILRLPRTPPLDLHSPLSAEWREGELW
jgi:aminoglycoside 2'-N-acetyltransferase I